MKKVSVQKSHFLDELKPFKGSRQKYKGKKELKYRMTEGTTMAGFDEVINLHRVPIKIEYPSTSELIKIEGESLFEPYHMPGRKGRGRPRLNLTKPKIETELKLNDVKCGKKRGRPKSRQYCPQPFSCGLCHFKGNNFYDLEEHFKSHTNKTLYECRYCNSTFTQKGNLMTHIRTHTKEKPFKCLYCDFAASQKVNLKVHIRTHTKEKPFKCNLCDFTSAQKCNLVTHVTRRHSNVEVVKSMENMDNQWGNTEGHAKHYRCGTCMFSCRLKLEMVEHMRKEHPYAVGYPLMTEVMGD